MTEPLYKNCPHDYSQTIWCFTWDEGIIQCHICGTEQYLPASWQTPHSPTIALHAPRPQRPQ